MHGRSIAAGTLLATSLIAQGIDDRRHIDWFSPGEFAKARKKAAATGRLILVKGISFGIDARGAADARCGSW